MSSRQPGDRNISLTASQKTSTVLFCNTLWMRTLKSLLSMSLSPPLQVLLAFLGLSYGALQDSSKQNRSSMWTMRP